MFILLNLLRVSSAFITNNTYEKIFLFLGFPSAYPASTVGPAPLNF